MPRLLSQANGNPWQPFLDKQTMTIMFHQVPWAIAMLPMAVLCLFSAVRAPLFVALPVPAGAAR